LDQLRYQIEGIYAQVGGLLRELLSITEISILDRCRKKQPSIISHMPSQQRENHGSVVRKLMCDDRIHAYNVKFPIADRQNGIGGRWSAVPVVHSIARVDVKVLQPGILGVLGEEIDHLLVDVDADI